MHAIVGVRNIYTFAVMYVYSLIYRFFFIYWFNKFLSYEKDRPGTNKHDDMKDRMETNKKILKTNYKQTSKMK